MSGIIPRTTALKEYQQDFADNVCFCPCPDGRGFFKNKP